MLHRACTARRAALTHTQTQAGVIAEATASDLAFLKACKLVGAKTNLQSNVQVWPSAVTRRCAVLERYATPVGLA